MAIQLSPRRRKARRFKRLKEEQEWAAKSGPVAVRFVDPATLRRDRDSDQPRHK